MAKRLITQARGKGGPRYRAPSWRYYGKIQFARLLGITLTRGEVIDLVNSVGHDAPLMVVKYENNESALLPATLGLRKGDIVFSGAGAPKMPGNITRLDEIPSGYPIYGVEQIPMNGPKFVRTSGTAARVVGREGKEIIIKMPSGKLAGFNPECRAVIGIVAGGGRTEKPWVKGGKHNAARAARNKLHPVTSGVAKNAVVHPFGGTHRRSLGIPTTTRRGTPPGRKVGQLWPRRTGKRR